MIKEMKRFIITALIVLSAGLSFGQQDALYSQYMFNPFSINPAYAGSRRSISTVLLHRSQWVGIDGAPSTQTFSIHSKIKETGLAWGLNLAHDQIGPSRNLWGALTGGYHVKMKTGYLSFAIRGGVYNSILNRSLLTFDNESDQFNVTGKESALVPSFDVGAYYYSNKMYAGLSVNHVTKHNFNFSDFPSSAEIFLRQHFMFNVGGVFEINRNFVLKPSAMLRYAAGAPLSADLNISALVHKFWWIGMSFRNLNSLVFLTEFNITDYLRMGYSFDLSLNELRTYNNGSHEIFIGFDFTTGKNENISPRYL